ncbi:extracellular solute-binding protein [Treponema socranskii]|uniref:extracellular solute-binding protein n=1 Tax=Treponema socranskii TaxID=53419 RepID=UPI003D91A557
MKKTLFAFMLLAAGMCVYALGSNDSKAAESAGPRPAWAKSADEVTGVVTIYTTFEETQQQIILDLWNKLYPKCKVEIVADSVGTLVTKIRADASSKADCIVGGMFAADGTKYHDVLQPYTSTVENEQLFHDKSGYYTYWDVQLMCLVVNPKILKNLGVTVKGYQDCLNPKLKGKIILADPAAASSGWRQLQTMLACMGDTFDDAKGWAYVEKIMGQSFKTNSSKDVFNLVNEGEYAVGLSYESTPAGIISLGGAVMEIVYPVEGNTAMASGGAVCKNSPNLTAAKAMIDLCASKEFQDERAKIFGRPTNSRCKPTNMPPTDSFKLIELDHDYLSKNKDKMLEHWNDLWAKVKGR